VQSESIVTTVAVVVGNPKPRSRTLEVASRVADAAVNATGLHTAERITVDLAELGPQLFDWGSSEVRAAVDSVRNSTVAIVASPTYKASYTGLLKSFLDWFSTTDLLGVTVIPVMVGAGWDHALAVEVHHLRPVLVELGASLPTCGFYVTEDTLDVIDEVGGVFMELAAPRLQGAVGSAQSG
jgi:FMN reductase